MATQITLSDTCSANTNITAAPQITPSDTSSANTNITAATQMPHTDTSSADTDIIAATQITLSDTASANTNITAATQIPLTDTSSADTNIIAATQITLSDTASANTNITAAPQIPLTDTSSANTNITAATQIPLTDTSSANTNITAATQIPLTDTSSADTNIIAATQIPLTDTCSANTNITAATRTQLDTLSEPLQTRSPLWRALRRTHKRLPTVADGCRRLRSQTQLLANTASPPDPQVKREPSLRIREQEWSNMYPEIKFFIVFVYKLVDVFCGAFLIKTWNRSVKPSPRKRLCTKSKNFSHKVLPSCCLHQLLGRSGSDDGLHGLCDAVHKAQLVLRSIPRRRNFQDRPFQLWHSKGRPCHTQGPRTPAKNAWDTKDGGPASPTDHGFGTASPAPVILDYSHLRRKWYGSNMFKPISWHPSNPQNYILDTIQRTIQLWSTTLKQTFGTNNKYQIKYHQKPFSLGLPWFA